MLQIKTHSRKSLCSQKKVTSQAKEKPKYFTNMLWRNIIPVYMHWMCPPEVGTHACPSIDNFFKYFFLSQRPAWCVRDKIMRNMCGSQAMWRHSPHLSRGKYTYKNPIIISLRVIFLTQYLMPFFTVVRLSFGKPDHTGQSREELPP